MEIHGYPLLFFIDLFTLFHADDIKKMIDKQSKKAANILKVKKFCLINVRDLRIDEKYK